MKIPGRLRRPLAPLYQLGDGRNGSPSRPHGFPERLKPAGVPVDRGTFLRMTLLRAAGISLAFGSRPIFHDLELVIEEGERVGLIGVNGSGKSTLMRILAGAMPPDSGELQLRRGARVTYLPQEPSFAPGATVESELTASGEPAHRGRAVLDR